jgi:hypothetical protein
MDGARICSDYPLALYVGLELTKSIFYEGDTPKPSLIYRDGSL